MRCPICDNKPANCDCTGVELEMHARCIQLESERDAALARVAALETETEKQETELNHLHTVTREVWTTDEMAFLRSKISALEAKTVMAEALFDGPCILCGETTQSIAGNPGRWPLLLCRQDGTGKALVHCVKCVTDKVYPSVDVAKTMTAEALWNALSARGALCGGCCLTFEDLVAAITELTGDNK